MGREHIENIKMLDGTEVAAIADPDSDSRAAAVALLPGQPRVFESYPELLAADVCDALVIATPNFTHIDVLRDALQTDAPMLIEKPLCTRVDDCLKPAQRANGRKPIFWVAREYRQHTAGGRNAAHDPCRHRRTSPSGGDTRAPRTLPPQSGGLEPPQCQCRWNFGGEMLPLLQPDGPGAAAALSVYVSGAQRVSHLDEFYGGRTPDILDSAHVILDYASGARAMLGLCMFAENSADNEQIAVVCDKGKLESLLPSMTLRYGLREDSGTRKVWGETASSGKGASVRRVWDTGIKYMGKHFGLSYAEQVRFAHAIRCGLPAEVTLEEGLRSVATGIAAHRGIKTRRVVTMAEVLPAGW